MASEHQFVEVINADYPGSKLVDYRQAQVFLRDNAFGILLYASICGVTPSLIEVAPTFKFDITLLSTADPNDIQRLTLTPKSAPQLIVAELTFNGQVVKEDGAKESFTTPLNQLSPLPAKFAQGHLYFEVAKTKVQYPAAPRLYIE